MVLLSLCLFTVVVFGNLWVGDTVSVVSSTSDLACADYSDSVPLHNPVEQGVIVPMFNFAPQKSQVAMFNFWSGKE